jgi:epoxyqueuosine reductase
VGFDTLRVAAVSAPTPGIEILDAWIAAGHHGDMAWIARGRDARADPALRLPTVRTALVFATSHHAEVPPDPGGRTGRVARYAWGRDYHNLIGKRLRKLRRALTELGVESWGGVDAAPILERSWARLAGLGYLGKNTMSIVPSRGSYYFLAVLFTSAALPPDRPLARDHCGRCTRCLTACPTAAFPAAYQLDATRCISYWTIEAAELAPPALRAGFGRWVFGCDVCQEVCPHNHRPPTSLEPDLAPRHAWLDLDAVVCADDGALLERFTGTPLRRPGAVGLKRNALIALRNLGDPDGAASAAVALAHPSPTVRAAAVWALRGLAPHRVPDRDPDPRVQAEIDQP